MVRLTALIALLGTATASSAAVGRRQFSRKSSVMPGHMGTSRNPSGSQRGNPSDVLESTSRNTNFGGIEFLSVNSKDLQGKRTQLHRAMSKLGEGSRGINWKTVKEGKVRVNGMVVIDPLTWVDLQSDEITVNGRQCTPSRTAVWLLNKPKNYLTSRTDDRGRPTVYELLRGKMPEGEWHFPVGRLDADSEGMLLFTNDGPLGDSLTDPSTCVWKEYLAWVRGKPSQETLSSLSGGIDLDGTPTRPADFSLAHDDYVASCLPYYSANMTRTVGSRSEPLPTSDKDDPHANGLPLTAQETSSEIAAAGREEGREVAERRNWCVRVKLREGRHRQVRKMLASKGHKVVRLVRVRIGALCLGNLAAGHVRKLTHEEVLLLRQNDTLAQDTSSPTRQQHVCTTTPSARVASGVMSSSKRNASASRDVVEVGTYARSAKEGDTQMARVNKGRKRTSRAYAQGGKAGIAKRSPRNTSGDGNKAIRDSSLQRSKKGSDRPQKAASRLKM